MLVWKELVMLIYDSSLFEVAAWCLRICQLEVCFMRVIYTRRTAPVQSMQESTELRITVPVTVYPTPAAEKTAIRLHASAFQKGSPVLWSFRTWLHDAQWNQSMKAWQVVLLWILQPWRCTPKQRGRNRYLLQKGWHTVQWHRRSGWKFLHQKASFEPDEIIGRTDGVRNL